jgi:hypothetical protein
MKSPAWGRGAVPLGATEGLGGRRQGSCPEQSHRTRRRPIIRWSAVFRLAGGLLLLRHTAGRLTNVGNQAESKPFTSRIRGGEDPNIGSVDSDAGRVEGATAVGRALFPNAVRRSLKLPR